MITITWFDEATRTLPEGGDRLELTTGVLDLDILETDTYDAEVMITDHSVERSSPVQDHVVQKSDRVAFTAIVSCRQSSTRLVEGAEVGPVELADGSEVQTIIVPEGTDRKGDVLDQLVELMKNGTEIDVEGLQRDIFGWMIERVSAPRTVETSGLLVCDISIKEIRKAEVEEVEAPSPRVERGRRRRDRGRERSASSEDPASSDAQASSDPEDRERSISVLRSAWNAISGGSDS